MPGAARPLFIPMVHSPLGVVGYVAASKLSSRGGKAEATYQHWSPPRQEARSGAEKHVVTSELNSARR
jgi:hypothetical protein